MECLLREVVEEIRHEAWLEDHEPWSGMPWWEYHAMERQEVAWRVVDAAFDEALDAIYDARERQEVAWTVVYAAFNRAIDAIELRQLHAHDRFQEGAQSPGGPPQNRRQQLAPLEVD